MNPTFQNNPQKLTSYQSIYSAKGPIPYYAPQNASSVQSNIEHQRLDHNNGIQIGQGYVASGQRYSPVEGGTFKFENIGKGKKIASEKNVGQNFDRSFPRYGDMKSSYIGTDAREIAYNKDLSFNKPKTMKKLPRASEPGFMPELETNESFTERNEENTSDLAMSRKKAVEQFKNGQINYTPSLSKLDPEDRYKMRKSSFDPTESWKKQETKSKYEKKFSLIDFEKIKELGTGKYGKVFLVKEKLTQYLCALKVIEKQLLKDEEITEQFIRELKIQSFLSHPNIVKMYGFFDDAVNIYIILEVALGGHLYKQLKPGSQMPEPKVAIIMRQVASAVNELHSNHIIHRDIKPENIVLNENIVKLCDFGWSVYHNQTMRNTFCGTPLYVSPEILKGSNYDEKIDIWSLGIMMYEMLIGENPFKITQEEELIKIVKDSIQFPSYSSISSEAKDFVMSCLQKNPSDRASIRELVNHDFFKKYPEKIVGKMAM